MTIEHSEITDPSIHEPKGVSSATSGSVYVADGSGSGDWTISNWAGWGYYKDDSAGQVISTTAVLLTNNGTGASQTAWLPNEIRGSGNLWTTLGNKISPITTGDSYNIRLDLPVTAESGTPAELTIQLDVGGLAAPSEVVYEKYYTLGKAPSYVISMEFSIHCLSSFKTNGGRFFLTTDADSITITNPSILITRTSSGDY